jgi:DNA-binding transcriptional ArsR family regulator
MSVSTASERLDATFFALSDATRRAILLRLAHGQTTVNDLTDAFDISQPAISRHLKVLERAGLVSRGRDAQRRPASIDIKPIADVTAWIARYQERWERTYQKLDAVLADELTARKRTQRRPRDDG